MSDYHRQAGTGGLTKRHRHLPHWEKPGSTYFLTFTLNDAVMGDVVEEPVTTAAIAIVVEDPDEGDTVERIELFGDGEMMRSDEPAATGRHWLITLQPEPGEHYYFVKVTQDDGNLLYSAPIWITTPAG